MTGSMTLNAVLALAAAAPIGGLTVWAIRGGARETSVRYSTAAMARAARAGRPRRARLDAPATSSAGIR